MGNEGDSWRERERVERDEAGSEDSKLVTTMEGEKSMRGGGFRKERDPSQHSAHSKAGLAGSALTLDDTSPRLLVKSLGVALLDLLERSINVDLDEGDLALLVDGTGQLTVGEVGGDEGGEGGGGRGSYELGDLSKQRKDQ